MAKKKTASKTTDRGPYLAAAVFCDSVLKGDDGAMTAVRIIDRLNLTIPADAPPDVPSTERQLLAHVEGLIAFKTGDSPGKHDVKLVMNSPSKTYKTVMQQSAEFRNEPYGGYSLRLKTAIAVHEVGLYWMDVILDDRLMTRIPLLISVTRAESEANKNPAEKPPAKAKAKKK